MLIKIILGLKLIAVSGGVAVGLGFLPVMPSVTHAAADRIDANDRRKGLRDVCGKGRQAVKVKFDFGCQGDRLPNRFANPIYDLFFSLIRFLTVGVGLVVVISIIIAGIQYSASEGNPEATMKAKNRVRSALTALFIYIFAFAAINYLVPGGLLT